MAFSALATWNVFLTGNDGTAGGGFDRNATGFSTSGTATLANTATPVFSDSAYAFVNSDVNAWLYLKSGSGITPGWYRILGVSAGAATLDAAIGHATLANCELNTLAGCATGASPTGITWGLDYSRQASPQFSYTDLVIDGTTNTKATSASKPFGVNHVGNVISVTSGTGFTVQRVAILSVVSAVATFDKALGTLSSTGGTGGLGGALASIGQAGALHVGGNKIFQKYAASVYPVSSVSANVSGGCLTLSNGTDANPTVLIGYNTVVGDKGNRPTNQATASGTGNMTLVTATSTAQAIYNVIFDGQGRANTRGVNFSGGRVYWCKFSAFTNNGVQMAFNNGSELFFCEATLCSTNVAIYIGDSGLAFGNYAHDNTTSGFNVGQMVTFAYNISANNTGSGSWGFQTQNNGNFHGLHNIAYKNGAGGFDMDANNAGGNNRSTLVNCIAWGNAGYNYRCNNSQAESLLLINCAGGGAGTANYLANTLRAVGFINLTADPTVDGTNGNFALNLVAGGGLACRAAGILGAFPGGSTTAYNDLGAVQSQATNIVTLAVVLTHDGGGRPVLTWTAYTPSTSYLVLRSDNGGAYNVIATLSSSILTYTDPSEPSGTVKYSVLADF